MNAVLKIFAVLVLLSVAAFCIFGFLASYELPAAAAFPWQIGYGMAAAFCVVGVVLLCLPRRIDE